MDVKISPPAQHSLHLNTANVQCISRCVKRPRTIIGRGGKRYPSDDASVFARKATVNVCAASNVDRYIPFQVVERPGYDDVGRIHDFNNDQATCQGGDGRVFVAPRKVAPKNCSGTIADHLASNFARSGFLRMDIGVQTTAF